MKRLISFVNQPKKTNLRKQLNEGERIVGRDTAQKEELCQICFLFHHHFGPFYS